MNELPRINTHTPLIYKPDKSVSPLQAVVDNTIKVEQDRRKTTDRRKRRQRPVIERRVSSDRRTPMFDETV